MHMVQHSIADKHILKYVCIYKYQIYTDIESSQNILFS